jgi:hypothetical protein
VLLDISLNPRLLFPILANRYLLLQPDLERGVYLRRLKVFEKHLLFLGPLLRVLLSQVKWELVKAYLQTVLNEGPLLDPFDVGYIFGEMPFQDTVLGCLLIFQRLRIRLRDP